MLELLCRLFSNARQFELHSMRSRQVLGSWSFSVRQLRAGQVLGCDRSEHLSKLRCRQLCSNARQLSLLTVSVFVNVAGICSLRGNITAGQQ